LRVAPARFRRDELLEALWPDLAPDSANLALNTTFSDLRKLLRAVSGQGYPSRYLLREGEMFLPAFLGNPSGMTLKHLSRPWKKLALSIARLARALSG